MNRPNFNTLRAGRRVDLAIVPGQPYRTYLFEGFRAGLEAGECTTIGEVKALQCVNSRKALEAAADVYAVYADVSTCWKLLVQLNGGKWRARYNLTPAGTLIELPVWGSSKPREVRMREVLK